jgi:hypothetical protein
MVTAAVVTAAAVEPAAVAQPAGHAGRAGTPLPGAVAVATAVTRHRGERHQHREAGSHTRSNTEQIHSDTSVDAL